MLVFGAGTDYALLLVSRYREELRRHDDKHEAMRIALRTAGPAILASGLTVMAALLVLILADVNSTAGLGPIGALGVGAGDDLHADDAARRAGDLRPAGVLAVHPLRRRRARRARRVADRLARYSHRPTRRTASGGGSASASRGGRG